MMITRPCTDSDEEHWLVYEQQVCSSTAGQKSRHGGRAGHLREHGLAHSLVAPLTQAARPPLLGSQGLLGQGRGLSPNPD